METGAAVIGFVFGILLGLFIQAAFLLWGAKIAGIENRTYGKALGTTILGLVASFVFSLVLRGAPVIGAVLGFIGGFLITALIMTGIFGTTFGKALAATVLAWFLGLVIIGGIVLIAILVAGVALV